MWDMLLGSRLQPTPVMVAFNLFVWQASAFCIWILSSPDCSHSSPYCSSNSSKELLFPLRFSQFLVFCKPLSSLSLRIRLLSIVVLLPSLMRINLSRLIPSYLLLSLVPLPFFRSNFLFYFSQLLWLLLILALLSSESPLATNLPHNKTNNSCNCNSNKHFVK